MPGMVDTHVHLMDPSATEREDFPTGTAAAAIAGVTTIIEHAHGGPVREPGELRAKAEYLRDRSYVDFGLAAHAWPDPDRPGERAVGGGCGVLQGLHLFDPWRARFRPGAARGVVHRGRSRGWRVPRAQRGSDPRGPRGGRLCAPAAATTRRSSSSGGAVRRRSRPGRDVAAGSGAPGVRASDGARQHTRGHRDGRP